MLMPIGKKKTKEEVVKAPEAVAEAPVEATNAPIGNCEDCNGTGLIDRNTLCDVCGGTGHFSK